MTPQRRESSSLQRGPDAMEDLSESYCSLSSLVFWRDGNTHIDKSQLLYKYVHIDRHATAKTARSHVQATSPSIPAEDPPSLAVRISTPFSSSDAPVPWLSCFPSSSRVSFSYRGRASLAA